MADEFKIERDSENGTFVLKFGEKDITSQVALCVIEIRDTEPAVGSVRLELNSPITLDLDLKDLHGPFTPMSNEQLKEVRTKLDKVMHGRMVDPKVDPEEAD